MHPETLRPPGIPLVTGPTTGGRELELPPPVLVAPALLPVVPTVEDLGLGPVGPPIGPVGVVSLGCSRTVCVRVTLP